VTPGKVVEFILLHDSFPRSIRFCADHMDAALHRISGCDRAHFVNDAERLSGELCSDLNSVSVGQVFKLGLHQYLDGIQQRLIGISTAMHSEYCEWLEGAEEEESQSQSQKSAPAQGAA
jgi:uncharacterized alpha-E superfamily protein